MFCAVFATLLFADRVSYWTVLFIVTGLY